MKMSITLKPSKLTGNYDKMNVSDESSESDDDGFHFHVPLPEDKPQTSSVFNEASSSGKLPPTLSSITIEDKGKEISFDDIYVDISRKRSTDIKKTNDALVASIMKKSAIGPGFEQLESVPPYEISRRKLLQENRRKRESSKGEKWFNMPAAEMTEELKNDLKVLQMRSVLDPKQFYKKNDMKEIPKYFHVGTVIESPCDFYSSRVPKKQRKKTLVEELLADAEFQRYNKQRYKEITEERKKTTFKAFKHAKRLKRKGKGRK